MQSTVTLPMVDGINVVVPDSLKLITPYVLREQQDWFEDEIRFLRRLLQPGQKIVDIGANYGLYTLSMAGTVGPSGHVWAFEPASATAAFLRESIVANGFDNVTLERCALSEKEGTAKLSMHDHAELNALIHDESSAQLTETVRLVTLDGYAKNAEWQDIDFIKIDAEGEEINILRSGREFFAEHSPLAQYEIKAGSEFHLELVRAFIELGYDSYRLVPGLDLLAPVLADSPLDRFQLNLFACKPDRAARLASAGWLVSDVPAPGSERGARDGILPAGLGERAYDWRTTLASLPYGRQLADSWGRAVTHEDSGAVEESLALYALSHDKSRTADERFHALECSFHRFESLVAASPTHPHLASLARIATEYGARAVAVETLVQLCNSIMQNQRADLDVPFLAPGARFDSVDPGGAHGDWLFMAAFEQLERLQSFSSFYPGMVVKDRLEKICDSPFAGPEMRRRLNLMRQRFRLPGSGDL